MKWGDKVGILLLYYYYNNIIALSSSTLGLYIQLRRVIELYFAKQKVQEKQWNTYKRSAFLIASFYRITESFSDSAIKEALAKLSRKVSVTYHKLG